MRRAQAPSRGSGNCRSITSILQLCFYSEQVARIQGHAPALMHVVLGSGEIASFKPDEFGAYFRRVRRRLEGSFKPE